MSGRWSWFDQREALRRHLLATLAAVPKRTPDVDWLPLELQTLTAAANQWMNDHGLPSRITPERVGSLDQMSTGADWGFKITLRIADDLLPPPAPSPLEQT